MSQNINNKSNPSTGGAGTGATDAGTTRDTTTTGSTGGGISGGGSSTGLSTPGSTGGGAAAGTATAREGLAGTAQEYGQKITEAAGQAKDYVNDKLSVAGDKLRELQQKDYSQIADEAKEYARQKPGQALLVSAAAGFLLGLLLRSTRR
ncbi:MAG: hypothetical protein LC785_06275 [Acidobacteria bacterium]|nr:hypothetical protein [Acidobacteriota bacterium]MCA1641550.1 hypothetical protein [Acidobacteriota bacterium]